jgi:hypothetical protein
LGKVVEEVSSGASPAFWIGQGRPIGVIERHDSWIENAGGVEIVEVGRAEGVQREARGLEGDRSEHPNP